MRRVVLSVFAVFTVFAVVAVSAVPAFALDLTLEKYVECDIPEFLSYEGEDLASAIDLFDSLTGLTMYVAIKESLNGVNDPSYEIIKSYYSDIDASSDQDRTVLDGVRRGSRRCACRGIAAADVGIGGAA